MAVTLALQHPDLARGWVGDAYADLAGADANPPYERMEGMKPVNNRYNASVGPLMGMGMPAVVSAGYGVSRRGGNLPGENGCFCFSTNWNHTTSWG